MPPLPILLQELRRATLEHPYDRKLLICPRPADGRELLRSLARSGEAWVGWEPWSLRQLSSELVGLDLAREGLRPADSFDVMALVDEALDAAVASGGAGPFGRGVPPAFREPIRRTIENLREGGLAPSALRNAAPGDPKLELLGRTLAEYEARLARQGLVDGPGLIQRAVGALAGETAALPPARYFLLPGLPLRGVPGDMVRALVGRGALTLQTDPVVGLPAPVGALWAEGGIDGVLSRLHSPEPPEPAPPRDCGISLFAAATPADELREVLRRCMLAGVPWDEVEIVAIDAEAYGSALDGLARRLEIPVTYSAGLDASRTRVGRVAEAYFRWVGDGFPESVIRRLLETGDLEAPPGDEQVSAPALARRLRRLQIGWGHERYLPAVHRALRALEREPAPGRDAEDLLAARERETAELLALRRLLEPVLAATPSVEGRHALDRATTSPAALSGGLLELLERVPAGDAVENTARAVLLQRLERARATLTRETSWRTATAILRSRLRTRVSPAADAGRLAPWTSTGGRLHLSDLASGGLAARPHTFVVGLAAGALGGLRSDPLLPESDVGRLNSAAGRRAGPAPLAPAAEQIPDARHRLAAMLARLRGNITLSYAAWDVVEGRVIAPAPELLQALRLREADPSLTYEDLRRHLGRLASSVPTPGGGAAGLLDEADVWLDALSTPDGRLRDGISTLRALKPGLDRGLAAAEARNGDLVTAYHGIVPPDPRLDPSAAGAILSATALEALGRCPLRYFYRYVLHVAPVRDPGFDPESWLDALERGSLLHAVFERAISEKPDSMDYADDAFAVHARGILQEEVQRLLQRLPAPNEVVFRAEVAGLEADVLSFVSMVRQARPRVERTELEFATGSSDHPAAEIAVGTSSLKLRGRVDRLDRLAPGSLRIVDYKTGTGRYHLEGKPFDGGRRLQHLLYALAVEALLPDERVDVFEYHFPTVRGENHVTSYAREHLEGGEELLGELLEIARSGHFVATQDPGDCRFCDFAAVCSVRQKEYGGADSPRAERAKELSAAAPEYVRLLRVRGD